MNSELALALIIKRWTEWQEVARYQLPSQQEAERQNLLKLYTLYKKMKEKKNCAVQAELTPHVIEPSLHFLAEIAAREEKIRKGDDALIVHMQPVDYENYFEYIRMDVETYNELFKLIEPKIKKQFLIKYPIPAHTRLQICLRYLASGDSMLMISSAFGVASNTVSKIVTETCQALWDILKDLVLPLPNKDIWKEKASAFEHQWDFPHCIGTIDKKQLVLQSPVTTEVDNNKINEPLSLFAITDASSCFSLITIGIEEQYGNVINFLETEIGRHLQNNTYDIPPPSNIIENGPEIPYVLIGDSEFPLTTNILQPYSSTSNLDLPKQVFNYRIGRARKSSDCAFRILTTQWKIFQKKFSTNIVNTIHIAKAAICLHNFLMIKENIRPFQDRRYSLISDSSKNINVQGCTDLKIDTETFSEEAEKTRDIFKEIFCEDGAILLEWE